MVKSKKSVAKNKENKENKPAETDTGRRGFLNRLWLFLAALGLFEFAAIVVSFLRSQGSSTDAGLSDNWLEAGCVDDFDPGSVTAFSRGGFYLSRLSDGGFLALSRKCTHLGCTVPWIEKEKKFVCPCHASVFDIKGDVLASPAPRALDLFEIRIENDIVRVEIGNRIKRSRFETNQAAYPNSEKA